MLKFKIGDKLKDVVTDFEGICLGISLYATGCVHYGLQGPMAKDGSIPDWVWFDEMRLKLLKEKVVDFPSAADFFKEKQNVAITFKDSKVGGPMPNPPSM